MRRRRDTPRGDGRVEHGGSSLEIVVGTRRGRGAAGLERDPGHERGRRGERVTAMNWWHDRTP